MLYTHVCTQIILKMFLLFWSGCYRIRRMCFQEVTNKKYVTKVSLFDHHSSFSRTFKCVSDILLLIIIIHIYIALIFEITQITARMRTSRQCYFHSTLHLHFATLLLKTFLQNFVVDLKLALQIHNKVLKTCFLGQRLNILITFKWWRYRNAVRCLSNTVLAGS